MSNRNNEEIAGIIRNILITKHGFEVDGDYVRKLITRNYGIGFYQDKESNLCICIYHKGGSQFSPTQRKAIFEVLSRSEFSGSFSEAKEGDSTDGKFEIWAFLRIKEFDGWENTDIADWVVKLFDHFITTVNLLMLM
jgi:hypothetical protein